MDETNPYAFNPSDVIVWNGIVVKFGYIHHLTEPDDQMRKATKEDTQDYLIADTKQ